MPANGRRDLIRRLKKKVYVRYTERRTGDQSPSEHDREQNANSDTSFQETSSYNKSFIV